MCLLCLRLCRRDCPLPPFFAVSSRSCLFFLLCYRDHRDLHSFPTRRSSDLGQTRRAGRRVRILPPPMRGVGEFARSEEHTSELQSRGHLVCRLLLEKKKKKRQYSSEHRYDARTDKTDGQ